MRYGESQCSDSQPRALVADDVLVLAWQLESVPMGVSIYGHGTAYKTKQEEGEGLWRRFANRPHVRARIRTRELELEP